MRFREQESIDHDIAEAKDLLSRLASVAILDAATVDWDDVTALIFKARAYLNDASTYALRLQGWAKTGLKSALKEVKEHDHQEQNDA